MIGPHVRPVRIAGQGSSPFTALAQHIAAEDQRRAKGLARTRNARRANRRNGILNAR